MYRINNEEFGSLTEHVRGRGGPRGGGGRRGGPRRGSGFGGRRGRWGGPRGGRFGGRRGGWGGPRGGRFGGRRGGWGGPRYRGYDYGYTYPYLFTAPRVYYGFDDVETSPTEPDWVGKKLVRRGQILSETDKASQNFVLESNIAPPYAIIGPGMPTPGGSDPHRLLIYIDADSIINSVVYS